MARTASRDQPLEKILEEIHSIAKNAKAQIAHFNEAKFLKAFEFARMAHEGQLRKDGSPYIIHPVAAAHILSEIFLDEETLIATLLHDVPEDTKHSLEEIEELFGTSIAFLVDGITKLSKVHYQNNMEQRQIESLKKLLLHTARDPRVILIKLADRLHNMRTLEFVDKPEKRLRISRETLEIYVPMANLLGIQTIKSELEDLCFKNLYPEDYEIFKNRIDASEEKLAPFVKKSIEIIQKELDKHHVDASIMYRKKTLFSIYQKLKSEKKDAEDVHDLITLRVLVDAIDDCYKSLGIIHTLFKPKTGKFKDYIAVPKVNEYRSLHTTVFGLKGVLTEFQIRTHEMQRNAEYGIALRMSKKKKFGEDEKRREFWIEQILAFDKEKSDNKSFLSGLKDDVFGTRIFVFTPKGDAIYLPEGSSGIDFAYAIHSDVGNTALKIEVNGEQRPVTAILKSSDTVRVLASDHSGGPRHEWLAFAKTNFAKIRIREFLRKESKRTKIAKGKQILQKSFDRAGLGLIEEINFRDLQKSLEKNLQLEFNDIHAVYAAVAEGSLDPLEIIGGLYPGQHLHYMKQRGFLGSLFHIFFHRDKKRPQLVEVRISGKDRSGLLRDVVDVLSIFSLNIVKLKGWHQTWGGEKGVVIVTLELEKFDLLNSICAHLEQIDGVESVERLFFGKHVGFFLSAIATILFWAVHPFLLGFFIQSQIIENHILVNLFIFFGVFMVSFLSFYLHIITRRYFAAFRQAKGMFLSTVFISLFALATVFSELYYYRHFAEDWFIVSLALIFILFYLGFQFLQFRKLQI